MTSISKNIDYQELVNPLSTIYEMGRNKAFQAVNTHLLNTYWEIGQYIVEFEQGGHERAKYGKALINNLAADLSRLHGKGFSRSNLTRKNAYSRKLEKSSCNSAFVYLPLIADNKLKKRLFGNGFQGAFNKVEESFT